MKRSALANTGAYNSGYPPGRKTRSQECGAWFSNGENVLITDTVGFIQKLPTTLIAAFRATLEEAKEADLILNVVDSSHFMREQQVKSVKDILGEIGLLNKPMITLLNKSDKLPEDYIASDDSSLFDFLVSIDNPVFCSGLTGFGKKEVLRTIGEKLIKKMVVWYLGYDCAL